MKTLLIPIGCPGSGKSTYCRSCYNDLFINNPVILSADDFFIREGKYVFVRENLGKAHRWIFNRFLQYIGSGCSFIIIDNTNLTMGEISKYVVPATAMGYSIQYKFFGDDLTIDDLEKRNVHNVPRETLESMMKKYKAIKAEFQSWGFSNESY